MLVALAVGLVVARPVLAHHGAAGLYDMSKAVMMKGTITKFEWTNPHNQIYFDVKDDKGNVVHWIVATEPPQVMLERGWTRRSLKEGDQVTVYAFIASNGAPVGNLQRLVLPDGKELSAR
jgi:exonuclease VII large subunit